MNDPKPCRECGQKGIEQSRTYEGRTEHWLCCRNALKCKAYYRGAGYCVTASFDTEEEAVEAWNKKQSENA